MSVRILPPLSALTALLLASPAAALTLDFEEFAHGDVVTHSQGVAIRVDNLGGGPDLGVAFDTNASGTADPDLQRLSPGIPGGAFGWARGNLAPSTNLGNVLVIQENWRGCSATHCSAPDDEGSRPAGTIDLDFSALGSFTSFSMDLVDVEGVGAEPGGVVFHLGLVQVASVSFMDLLSDPTVVYGDNSANHVDVLSGIAYDRVTIRMGGSGGIDNLTAAVPEPSAALLFALGSLTVGTGIRRRRSL